MVTEKDLRFVEFLLEQTKAGKVDWQVREREDQFLTFFNRGDDTITVGKEARNNEAVFWLTFQGRSGREALRISSDESRTLAELWFFAKRNAFGVDAALDDIMGREAASHRPEEGKGKIGDEDIPF